MAAKKKTTKKATKPKKKKKQTKKPKKKDVTVKEAPVEVKVVEENKEETKVKEEVKEEPKAEEPNKKDEKKKTDQSKVEKAEEKPEKVASQFNETKVERRMRLSILLLSVVVVLLWGALLYLLNESYTLNNNYAELIERVDTLSTLYEGKKSKDDYTEVYDYKKEYYEKSEMDDVLLDELDEEEGSIKLLSKKFECDHPYSEGDEATGYMNIVFPVDVDLSDISQPETPLNCAVELTYKSGTLTVVYSHGEAYMKQLDPQFKVIKTIGERKVGRDPLTYDPDADIYDVPGYYTAYDMKSDDSECVASEMNENLQAPCGTPGNQFVTYLGGTDVFIEDGTSEADREEILEMFDVVMAESDGGPFDK